jgi:hypothetical protein
MRGAIPPLPNKPSWCGAQLKHRINFTFQYVLVCLTVCNSSSCTGNPIALSGLTRHFVTCAKGKVKVNVILSLYLTKHQAMKTYWRSGSIAPHILISALDGGAWSASRPGHFTPCERASGIQWVGK